MLPASKMVSLHPSVTPVSEKKDKKKLSSGVWSSWVLAHVYASKYPVM